MSLDDFIAEHTDMVRSLAVALQVELKLRVEIDDLVGYGFQGLLEARERFDPSKGVPFARFAHYRVRGEILDGVRRMARLPRRTYEQCQQAAARDAALEDAGDARAEEARPAPDVDLAVLAFDALIGKVTASLVAAASAQEEKRTNPEEALLTQIEKARVAKAVRSLPDREQLIVQAVYFDELPLDDIGGRLGISRSRVSRIHTRALGLLRESLG